VKSLIIAPDWIGHAVMAQPLLATLKRQNPEQHIDVLARPQVAAVFAAMREVDSVIDVQTSKGWRQISSSFAQGRALADKGYERAFVLTQALDLAVIPRFAGIVERIGLFGAARYGMLNAVHASLGQAASSMIDNYAQLAFDVGQTALTPVPPPQLRGDKERERMVRAKYGFADDEAIFVLCPGAGGHASKRWPARHYAALANLIANDWPDAHIVCLGGLHERTLATEIGALSGQNVRNLCGTTSLSEGLSLLSQANGIVSNDSGLMHLAAAFGRPQVAVFGATDPRLAGPRSAANANRIQTIWLAKECSPCGQTDCPLGHLRCLHELGPQQVFTALQAAMRTTRTNRKESFR
jgi:heptosyltransferase II